jgi:hypothetical protein
VYDRTVHGSRQDAIDSIVQMARRHFSRRLASEHAWLEARVHAEATEILAQIDAMIVGARKKRILPPNGAAANGRLGALKSICLLSRPATSSSGPRKKFGHGPIFSPTK